MCDACDLTHLQKAVHGFMVILAALQLLPLALFASVVTVAIDHCCGPTATTCHFCNYSAVASLITVK